MNKLVITLLIAILCVGMAQAFTIDEFNDGSLGSQWNRVTQQTATHTLSETSSLVMETTGVTGSEDRNQLIYLKAGQTRDLKQYNFSFASLNFQGVKSGIGGSGAYIAVVDYANLSSVVSGGSGNNPVNRGLLILGNTTDNFNQAYSDINIYYDKTTNEIVASHSGGERRVSSSTLDGNAEWVLMLVTFSRGDSSNEGILTSGTLSGEQVTDNVLVISARDSTTGLTVDNFEVGFNNGSTFSTTTGNVTLSGWTNGNYTITVNGSNYVNTVTSFEHVKTTWVYNDLSANNAIVFTFIDDKTLQPVLNATASLQSDSSTFGSYNTTTTNITLTNISSGSYEVRYTSPGYHESSYYFSIPLAASQNSSIDLYLFNSSVYSNITAIVVDQVTNELEGARIKVLRYDYTLGAYTLRELAETNFEGEALFHAELNKPEYQFIIEYPVGTTVLTTNTQQALYSTLINFPVEIGEGILEDYYQLQTVNYNLTFLTSTDNFKLTYSDSANSLQQACLQIYRIQLTTETLVNSSCLTATTGNIFLGVQNISGANYRADALFDFGEGLVFGSSESFTYITTLEDSRSYLFYTVIITVTLFMMLMFIPALAVAALPTPTLILTYLGVLNLNLGVVVGLQVMFIIIGVVIGGRE